jgi:hypothetical protein
MASADNIANPAAEATPSPEPTPAAPSSLLTRLLAAAFVVVVVLVECAIAYLYIPSQSDVAAMAEGQVSQQAQAAAEAVEQARQAKQEKPMQEIKLGDFSVSATQLESNSTLRIDFELYGTILEENMEDFISRYGRSERRLREQVILVVRNAEISALTDPDLGLIKRKILEKSNQTLGKPLLQAVVFSDFSFVEQ